MGARVRQERALVCANVGVHADVEITVDVDPDGDGAWIRFGDTGPDLRIDVADLDSMERLATGVMEGARLMRDRIAARSQVSATTTGADHLVGAGVAQ